MAKARKLKVFRTPIGFHDAYVAVPSQKAALEALGSGTDLFAAGAAELVTDPALTKPALARPGEVIRKARGTDAEHVRALGEKTQGKPTPGPSREREGKKPGRRPSALAVDKAEKAVEVADARHKAALDRLRAEEQALEQRRQALEKTHRGERERLELALDTAREKYRAALADWAG
ncbi:MAG: hypothetical protein ABI626_10360 [Sphingomicrobium sp.]